jgi:hypothetical protein
VKEMLLLGAGASVEAGVPDSYDMTKRISEHFHQDVLLRKQAHVISFVIGGLLFQHGVRGNDPLAEGVNVEELFNAVILLAERNTLEAAPFVGSWHAMVQEFDKESIQAPNLDRLLKAIFEGIRKEIIDALPSSPPSFGGRNIDKAIENAIKKAVEAAVKGRSISLGYSDSVGREVGDYVMEIVKRWLDNLKNKSPHSNYAFQTEFKSAIRSLQEQPGEGEIFERTAESMIRALTKLVWIDSGERVVHLESLLRLVGQQKRLVVATLNYDNSIELLSQRGNASCNTGIAQWSEAGTFDFAGDGIQLIKLHGSIDWVMERGIRTKERPLPHTLVRSINSAERVPSRPAVIFGQRNKLTAEGPFLDLLRAFQLELSASERLTVVGYSFRDDHVNEYISQWLNKNRDHKLRVINRSFAQRPSEYGRHLLQYCQDRLEVIEEKAGDGLKKAYPAESLPSAEAQPSKPTQA